MTEQPWRKVQDQISAWALETLDTERAAMIICISDLLARHLYQLQAGETMTDQQNSSAASEYTANDALRAFGLATTQTGVEPERRWEAINIVLSYLKAQSLIAAQQAVVTDAMCEAAVKANLVDRIQGFTYKTHHVIRDVFKDFSEQKIWEINKDDAGADDKFYHQCRIERMRAVLSAALAAQPLAAPVETPDQGSMYELAREQTYSSIETCRECGVSDPCGEDCPNYVEPKSRPGSSAGNAADIAVRLREPVMLRYNAEQINAERREAANEIDRLRLLSVPPQTVGEPSPCAYTGYIAQGDENVLVRIWGFGRPDASVKDVRLLYSFPPPIAGEPDARAVSDAYSDWAWEKEGTPVGLMLPNESARAGFFAGAKWASQLTRPHGGVDK